MLDFGHHCFHASFTTSPAPSRPHFLNRWKHFSAGSSLATNRTAGSFWLLLMCSHHEPPGTARLSNCCQSNRLPSMMLCPLPWKVRHQETCGLPQRAGSLARAQELNKEGHGLEHWPAGQRVGVFDRYRFIGIAVPVLETFNELLHVLPAIHIDRRGASCSAPVLQESRCSPP